MHWSNIEEIAEQLEESYEHEEIPEYNLPYLKEMVLSLPNFEDHEVEVQESTMKQILEHWIDIRNEE
jgi:FeS assembly protein IscX|tara:strand:+ start:381 stop:581 length:201 start_codon:yes stop_codon:yes gene_type:complete